MINPKYDNYIIYTIKQGQYFGELELIDNKPRQFKYIANEDVEIIYITKKDFNNLFFQLFPEIGKEIIKDSKNLK